MVPNLQLWTTSANPSLVVSTGTKLSKFEQCSAWNAYPLRQSQVHYAALDSFILIEIFFKLKEQHNFEEILHSDNDVIKPNLICDDQSDQNSLFED